MHSKQREYERAKTRLANLRREANHEIDKSRIGWSAFGVGTVLVAILASPALGEDSWAFSIIVFVMCAGAYFFHRRFSDSQRERIFEAEREMREAEKEAKR